MGQGRKSGKTKKSKRRKKSELDKVIWHFSIQIQNASDKLEETKDKFHFRTTTSIAFVGNKVPCANQSLVTVPEESFYSSPFQSRYRKIW